MSTTTRTTKLTKKHQKAITTIAKAYADANFFSASTLDRANKDAKTKNYMFAKIIGTTYKGKILTDKFGQEIAESIAGLAVYRLCNNDQSESLVIGA